LRSGESRFDEELKSVIFSHVGPSERLGADSLDEIVEYKTQETYDAIGFLRKELSEVNKEIAAPEAMQSANFKKALQAQLAEKQRELDSHDAGRPGQISKPELDAGKQSEMAALALEIDAAQAELVALRGERERLLEEQKLWARRTAVAVKLLWVWLLWNDAQLAQINHFVRGEEASGHGKSRDMKISQGFASGIRPERPSGSASGNRFWDHRRLHPGLGS